MKKIPSADILDEFALVPSLMQLRFDTLAGSGHAYTTDADGLFERFLATLPQHRRQHYSCSACRKFVERYGALAAIDAQGRHESALWDGHENTMNESLAPGIQAMAKAVRRARITGVFVASEPVLGTREAGGWAHLSVEISRVHDRVLTARQVMAAKREEFDMIERGLGEFPVEVVRQAHALLSSGNLYRSEKCLGVARWLLELHEARDAARSQQRENLTWVAVASAPAGFCHVRGGMIGTLLEDISAELPFAAIKARFDAKLNPTRYMRPSASPRAGNIAQAESIVANLDSAGSLARRFASHSEVDALWRPPQPSPKARPSGLFGHLLHASKPMAGVKQPDVTITWDKFSQTVLPEAIALEYSVAAGRAPYVAIVTAVNRDAPPILQWDRPDKRNPASWYVYSNGSFPKEWNLKPGVWCPVTVVCLRPSMWYGSKPSNQGRAAVLVLQGCRDTEHTKGGGFFPEALRSEFHGIRRTMEAYAKDAEVQGRDEASACGISLQEGVTWSCRLRVTSKGGVVGTYLLDRWD